MLRRLLYLITQTEFGGAQRYVLELAKAAQGRYEVAVATGRDGDGHFVEALKQQDISHFYVESLLREINPLTDLKCLNELKSIYKRLQPDLVHLNSTKAGVLGSLACGRGVRSVYTVHGWIFNEELPAVKKAMFVGGERFSASFLDRIIVLSRFDWERGAQHGIPRNKMRVIQNGLRAEEYLPRDAARRELALWCKGLSVHDRIILCIANFYPTKGLRYLVQAMQHLQAVDAKLVVIGDGEERPLLEQLVKELKLELRVLLPGRLNNAAWFMKAADVFVLSSVKEGLPYVILEALQAEVPIVTTSVGGIPEVLDRELVPPKDPQALAAALDRQLEHGQRSGQPAPSFEQMCSLTFELYDELLQSGPGTRDNG